ncbi:hypothetical protein NEIG_01458 [Nematocida sp. ERTm5]|nr:hypothetical protein NEIG_01458 [Nematocida sp. ERTm5]
MSALLDIYKRILSPDTPTQTYSLLTVILSIFIGVSVFISNTYIFSELDKIASKLGYPTIGLKSIIALIGLLYSPITTILPDLNLGESVWYHSSVFSITALAGFCIIFKKKKERIYSDSIRHTIFFQTIGTMASPIVGLYSIITSYSSVVLIVLYSVYFMLFTTKGKDYGLYLHTESSTEKSLMERTFNRIINKPSDSTNNRWINIIISSTTMGSLIGITFKDMYYIPLYIAALFILCILSLHSKKTSYFRNMYSLGCSCIIIKGISKHITSIIKVILSNMHKKYTGYIIINNIYVLFPIMMVILVGMFNGRYKLCFSIAISLPIHVFLLQKSIIPYVNTSENAVVDRSSLYSLVFTVISTILLFINNEIRTGYFEIEVGIILIMLYIIYIFCILNHPILQMDPFK